MKRASALVLSAMLVVAVCGCRAQTQQPPARVPQTPPATATPTPTAEPVPLDQLALGVEPVVSGLTHPLFVTHAGDDSGRIFVVEQPGRIRVVRDGVLSNSAFLDITRKVSIGGERGLLGLAFEPGYAGTGRFYVNYTDRRGDTIVARYVADDPASDAPRLSKPQVVLKVAQPYANHNGGCIVFGPDGRLLVGMGDGGSGGDPQNRAQDDGELLGKILSLDVTGTATPRPRVLAKGLRNPWRFSIDPVTQAVWIADVGQSTIEEVDVVDFNELPGANFGWNLWEGDRPYPEGAQRDRDGYVFPAFVHPRDEAQSITGGYVYRGTQYPAMAGTYIYGDFSAGWIGAARATTDGFEHRIVNDSAGVMPSSFGVDESKELYVCDYEGGAVLRVTAGAK